MHFVQQIQFTGKKKKKKKRTNNLEHFEMTLRVLQTWLVGDGWSEEEQLKASKGTLFIPFSQFPPKKMSKDCFYHSTPAMIAPKSFTNIHSCEVSNELTFSFPLLLVN